MSLKKVEKEIVQIVCFTEKLSSDKEREVLLKEIKITLTKLNTENSNIKFVIKHSETKGSGMYFKVENFNRVYLTPKWVQKAKYCGICYPKDCFTVIDIKGEGDTKTYSLVGSIGGRFDGINWNEGGVIKNNTRFK